MKTNVICPTCGRKYSVEQWKVSEGSVSLTNPSTIIANHLEGIRLADKEHFMILCLDTRLQIICQEIVSIGTLNGSLVHPREVFKIAIRNNAHAIIIAHNHPSREPKPSLDDIDITKRLCKAGNLLGIRVLDHIIVAKEAHFSFETENML